MMNRKPHKHAEVIKAWADGAVIEVKNESTDYKWWTFQSDCAPSWSETNEYRIKPEPKPDVESYLVFRRRDGWIEFTQFIDDGNVMEVINIIRDGETGKIKSAEVFE
jgi:hypothetical protein